MVDKIPRLIGVQSEAISPIYKAFSQKTVEIKEVPSKDTLAEGIGCVRPIKGREILEIAQLTRGGFEIVSEMEIIQGWKELSQRGVYVEPTSAFVVKAIDRLTNKGLLNQKDNIVLVLTGSGLKATKKLAKYVTRKIEEVNNGSWY